MIFIVIACQTEEYIEQVSLQPVEEPSQYTVEESWTEEAEETIAFDLGSIENSINDILPKIRSYNSAPILTSYADVMTYADSYCPSSYEQDGSSFWYGQCESSAGMSYNGYLFYNTYADMDFFGDGGVWDVIVVSGVTDMVYPSTNKRVHWGGMLILQRVFRLMDIPFISLY